MTAVACLATLGAACGVLLSRIAAVRSQRQPMPFDPQLEARLADTASAHPAWAQRNADATAWFVDPALAAAFAAAGATPADQVPADTTDAPGSTAERDVEQLEALSRDREMYPGACGFLVIDDAPYLVRGHVRDSLLRRGATAAACALTGALAAWAAPDVWAALAILVLGFTGWLIALVDHDTLFLDISTWWAGSAAAAAFAAVSALDRVGPGQLGWALFAGALWWGLFEAMNLAYKLLRGVDGMGGGDGMIAFPATFVAVAVTGSIQVALWAVLAGIALALLCSLPLVVAGRRGGRDAFALGPFLASGWQAAVAMWALGVLI